MKGRPKEFDRKVALKSAMVTFWKQGFEATSVTDLVEATGVNRGSMYDTFGSKHDLYLEALNTYAADATAHLEETLNSTDGSPLENLRSFFDSIAEMLYSGKICLGCMILNAAVELAPTDPEIASFVKKVSSKQKKLISKTLQQAAIQGELSSSSPHDLLADFAINHLRGLIVSAKSGTSKRKAQENIEFLFNIINSSKIAA